MALFFLLRAATSSMKTPWSICRKNIPSDIQPILSIKLYTELDSATLRQHIC